MDYENQSVIYKIINIENAKFYIGSSIVYSARRRKHLRDLRANKHHCPHLQAAWNKYGESSFVFRVVEVIDNKDDLQKTEQKWLDEHHGKGNCYNFARYVDNSNRGVVRTESHKLALSVSLTEFYKNNPHPARGKKHSEKSKLLMSKNRSGKPVSDATKDLIRQANLGKKASEQTKLKLSEMRKGKKKSEEHLAKFNKSVIEITTGIVYPSLKDVKEKFEMSPGSLARALKSNKPITKGKNAGKHFKYVDPSPDL